MSEKKVITHPSYSKMIESAIKATDDPLGASRPYIKKYLETNYNVSNSKQINTTIRNMVFAADGKPKIKPNPKHTGHYFFVEQKTSASANTKTKSGGSAFSTKTVVELEKLLKKKGIDKSSLKGSGANGSVKKMDLILALENGSETESKNNDTVYTVLIWTKADKKKQIPTKTFSSRNSKKLKKYVEKYEEKNGEITSHFFKNKFIK